MIFEIIVINLYWKMIWSEKIGFFSIEEKNGPENLNQLLFYFEITFKH